MCGIAGILNFDRDEPVREQRLRAMLDTIAHRGPDDHGIRLAGHAGLAHARLSILDLSRAGQQPMCSADGRYWISYNGEIYNFAELRETLRTQGCRFRSTGDTEVLVELYARIGQAALERVRGMYAFAVWDTKQEELFLARDPLGIKPLYYYVDERRLVFASELKAILALPEVPGEIDLQGVHNFFAYGHSTAPVTMYKGIRKLQPGHWLRVRGRHVGVRSFWSPELAADGGSQRISMDEAECRLGERLGEAVRSHLVSDVPVGVLLSGGLDSSGLVALMAREGRARPKTFSVGFDAGNHYSELGDARAVAEHFGTDHHELTLTKNDLEGSLEDLVRQFDEPFGDPAAFPTYFVSRLAADHVKVCLSGEGADELFGGYRRYLAERYGWLYRMLPGYLRSSVMAPAVARVPRCRRLKQLVRTIDIDDPVQRQANWQMVFTDDVRHELFARETGPSVDGGVYESFASHRAADGMDGLNGVLYADSRSWLADRYLEKADKMSMAHGLELRVPFLDLAVAEYAFGLPIDFKVKADPRRSGRSLKRLYGKFLADLLPKAILDKPKHGFAVPLDPWFRGDLGSFVQSILFDSRTLSRGYFDERVTRRLFDEHVAGREVRSNHLWLLLLFELWHREHVDQRSTVDASRPRHAAILSAGRVAASPTAVQAVRERGPASRRPSDTRRPASRPTHSKA